MADQTIKADQESKAKSESYQTTSSNSLADQSAASDPIHGSLGPKKYKEEDFANDEQRLEYELRKKKPIKYEIDPDIHDSTQKSIQWAENNRGESL